MKLSVNLFTTLDGVSQGPGGAEEDPRNGFDRGGWLMPVFDAGCGEVVQDWFSHCSALLLGRRTFDMMAPHWSQVTDPADPVAKILNTYPKYVVTSTPVDGPWTESSTALGDDFLEQVRQLRQEGDGELQVHGSVRLARTLHEAGLVDVYRLLVAPVVVGDGAGIFTADGPAHTMRVATSRTTESGVVALELLPGEFRAGLAVVEDGKDAIAEA